MRVFGQIMTVVCLVAVAAVPEAQQKPEADRHSGAGPGSAGR